MRKILNCFIAAMLLSWVPLSMAESSVADEASSKSQMERLAEKVLNETVGAVRQSGGFHPYAMLMRGDDTVHVVGYSGDPKKEYDKEAFTSVLYGQVVKALQQSEEFTAAAIVKPQVVTTSKNVTVPGILLMVDHRYRAPLRVFQPFVPLENGEYALGEVMYLPDPQALFIEP